MQFRSISSPCLAVILLGASPPLALADGCFPGPYIVFFDADSSAIKKEALEILETAIQNEGFCGAEPMLAGFSDSNENPRIARRRIVAVKNYLESRGVFVTAKNMRTFDARVPRHMTRAKTAERQSRRVEFIYGPAKR